ncbi:NAD(P)-dependent dehydrogenase (short-subunit alcohol dehydrogenase family) [Kribbella voronezhensis]|uniref:NAD(P)-dependent dehydrogenase (Short-subunit alcohol dehydrogenase family) n=1 Tax=Kribbella voronezhensis TaxID=2512212 RepID=A0A4R7T7U8_9ACTN|nr:SDR family oxidoreductase [Kribbella voronezhensis]TDU87366.1 NAD(P)-dependent dehydrogenase (short-subunit alcohol dehydrogenase family) [Kribbella voronezhensis]
MDLQLTGRTAVVTGASKGIGLACAEALAWEGASVVAISRSPENLAAAQDQLAAKGLKIQVEAVDLTDADAAKAVFERIGAVDILINSAGAARRTPVDELSSQTLHAAMEAKYFTYMHAIDAVIRGMAERGNGAIVNVVGQGGRQANELHIGGGAANAALMLASVGYAKAYAGRGVRVNVINPGMTLTGRVDEGLEAAVRSTGRPKEELLAEMVQSIPMGRAGEPEEVADVATFLASPRASYVTGSVITMDGGSTSAI